MIAYNPIWLNNLLFRRKAFEAFNKSCIIREELDAINNKYGEHFYSPNLFIRIGLLLLTLVIMLFSFGLFALITLNVFDKIIGGLCVFFGMLCYAALEFIVRSKNHLCSGVDDALIWGSAFAFFCGISLLMEPDNLSYCLIAFVISLIYTVRFGDAAMSAVCYVSLLGVVFFSCIQIGSAAKAIVPFLLMTLAAIVYLLVKRKMGYPVNLLYYKCLEVVLIVALLSFYLAGNYFVVRELSNEMFDMNLAKNETIPLGWLFWIFTIAMPVVYIFRGIQKRDSILIRVGLILIAAITFTIRYYYSVAPPEVVMVTGGLCMLVISYGLSRFLKEPKYGFSNVAPESGDEHGKVQIESLLVAETLAAQSAGTAGKRLGGGDFGGGGASGDY